ncbi:MAG: hypothetical protein COA99_13605 [Moraxellaceae bacterium]|nr:MAG: hypothetical protein COA99_13605 [Moraxellaceae bacterium]
MFDSIYSLVGDMKSNQKDSEALVALATFFYKVDGRITLDEEEYINNFLSVLEWNSSIDITVFQKRVIPTINQVLDGPIDGYLKYLGGLMDDIESKEARALAKKIAQEISDVDGEVADLEVQCLDYIKNF